MSTPPQANDSIESTFTDTSFLDAPEVEVMPGVYMTDFAAIKREAALATQEKEHLSDETDFLTAGYVPTPSDIAAMESHQSHLQSELQVLESQLALLHQKITQPSSFTNTSFPGPVLPQPHDSRNDNDENHPRKDTYMTMGELTGLTGIHLVEQIRAKIAQLTKHHEHLKHSQKQLHDLLLMDDPDITEAYNENKITLVEQINRLKALHDEEAIVLTQLGEHYAPKDTTTTTDTTISSNNAEQAIQVSKIASLDGNHKKELVNHQINTQHTEDTKDTSNNDTSQGVWL